MHGIVCTAIRVGVSVLWKEGMASLGCLLVVQDRECQGWWVPSCKARGAQNLLVVLDVCMMHGCVFVEHPLCVSLLCGSCVSASSTCIKHAQASHGHSV